MPPPRQKKKKNHVAPQRKGREGVCETISESDLREGGGLGGSCLVGFWCHLTQKRPLSILPPPPKSNLLKQIGPADMWVQSPSPSRSINTGAQCWGWGWGRGREGRPPPPRGADILNHGRPRLGLERCIFMATACKEKGGIHFREGSGRGQEVTPVFIQRRARNEVSPS